jgi:RNA polymerase sigma factor (sigma-70 family)
MTPSDTAPLVHRAAGGDELAWRRLHQEFTPVMRCVALGYRLGEAQAADVVAVAWLRLVENIANIRRPEALAGWLTTTVRRECLARLRDRRREQAVDYFVGDLEPAEDAAADAALIAEDRRRVVRTALAQLPEGQQKLMLMLFERPDTSYVEVGARMSMPVGSIGPTRARVLAKLRKLISAEDAELATAG